MKRTREELDDSNAISFYVYNQRDKHLASFDLLPVGGSNEEKGYHVLQFHRPGLKRADLYTLYVLKDDNQQCIYSCALSQGEPLETTYILDRKYVVYETYTLAQDREDAGITFCLYIQIKDSRIQVDMSLGFLPLVLPFFKRTVTFFPWNLDPVKFNLKVDYTKLIQKTPLWFKARGEVTGTKAYKLFGFWVPTKKENPNWKWDDERVFDAESQKNVDFGAASEDKALLSYALFNKDSIAKIELAGWCKTPPPLPSTWGASPDALVTLKSLTWEEIPDTIQKHYPDYKGKHQHGVLEIKSSLKGKLSMEAYFFPQIYMEMMSTQRLWCDLIRYTDKKTRVYRVWRHRPTEDTLVSLIKYAYQNRDRLQDIVQEDPFVKMRAYFKRLASTLSFVEIENPKGEIALYEKHLKEKSQPENTHTDYSFLFKKSKKETLVFLEEADANQKLIYGALNNPNRFKELVEKQISLYQTILLQ